MVRGGDDDGEKAAAAATTALAFDREKRVYKDAYVRNFRRVRHFPALAAIGAGHSDGESIILVQEAPPPASTSSDAATTATPRRAPSLLPPDALEEMFERTPPLSSFRSAVLCKHTNARARAAADGVGSSSPAVADSGRYGMTDPPAFKPPCPVAAKSAIERKIEYDSQAYSDKSPAGRSFTVREGVPQWSYSNPTLAKEEIRTKKYFNVPPEGVIVADRKYTREFIRKNVEATQASRNQRAGDRAR